MKTPCPYKLVDHAIHAQQSGTLMYFKPQHMDHSVASKTENCCCMLSTVYDHFTLSRLLIIAI